MAPIKKTDPASQQARRRPNFGAYCTEKLQMAHFIISEYGSVTHTIDNNSNSAAAPESSGNPRYNLRRVGLPGLETTSSSGVKDALVEELDRRSKQDEQIEKMASLLGTITLGADLLQADRNEEAPLPPQPENHRYPLRSRFKVVKESQAGGVAKFKKTKQAQRKKRAAREGTAAREEEAIRKSQNDMKRIATKEVPMCSERKAMEKAVAEELRHPLSQDRSGCMDFIFDDLPTRTRFAKLEEYRVPWSAGRSVIWADGSYRGPQQAGVGVAWKGASGPDAPWAHQVLGKWSIRSYTIPEAANSLDTEFAAISLALSLAVESKRAGEIVLYSDNSDAMKCLRECWERTDPNVWPYPAWTTFRMQTLSDALACARTLTGAGAHLEVRWVPGHRGVVGVAMADKTAGISSRHRALPPPSM